MDIAQIGFKADSRDLVKARRDMEALEPAAAKAERASDKLGNSVDELGDEARNASAQVKGTTRALGDYDRKAIASQRVTERLSTGVRKMVKGFAAFAALTFAATGISQSIDAARELSSASAELSTLLPQNSSDLAELEAAALSFGNQFGTSQANQIAGFYSAVSAGASTATAAIDILEASNKLAIGGVTDVATGVDILTTATNAYAATGLEAADASDILFTGMKAGKTTITQLSAGLGNVIPIAAGLGVEFDQLVAGTAALTTSGIKTSQAITSLRAILTGVAKPTEQAKEAAARLGIEFNTASLKSKGLAGFLEDVVEKTGGSADEFALLFGSVEALNAAIAFAGAGGEAFEQILAQMADRAGATDEAFQKVASSLDFRFTVLTSKIGNLATTVGTGLLQAFVLFGEGVERIIPIAVEAGKALLIAFGPLIAKQMAALTVSVAATASGMIAGLIPAIGSATAAMVAFSLSNPFTAFALAVSTAAAAVFLFRDDIGAALGESGVTGTVKSVVNAIVQGFVGAFNSIGIVWKNFPSIIGDVVVSTANLTLGTIAKLVNGTIELINSFIQKLPEFTGLNDNTIKLRLDESGGLQNPFEGTVTDAATAIADEFNAAKRDYFGAAVGVIENGSSKVKSALASVIPDASVDLEALLAGANDGGGSTIPAATPATGGFSDVIGRAQENLDAIELERRALDLSAEAAARLRIETDLLSQANAAGVNVTAAQTAEIEALAAATVRASTDLANAAGFQELLGGTEETLIRLEQERQALSLTGLELEKFKATTELLNEARRNGIELTAAQTAELETAADRIAQARVDAEEQTAATDKITDSFDDATASARNFARSLVDGLRNGKSIFRSFADTALNALDNIANKLLDSALNGLFGGPTGAAGTGGGIGGFFGSLFGGSSGASGGGIGGFFGSLFGGSSGAGGGGIGGFLSGGISSILSGIFEKGGAFDGTRAFAKGGAFTNSIVDQATPFRFGGSFGSQLGVMGEAGPEAIVPLERGPDGALGIQAFGGGGRTGGNSRPAVNLTINNNQTLTGAISGDDVRRMGEEQQQRTESNIRQRLPQLIEEQRVNGATV